MLQEQQQQLQVVAELAAHELRAALLQRLDRGVDVGHGAARGRGAEEALDLRAQRRAAERRRGARGGDLEDLIMRNEWAAGGGGVR